MDDFAAGAEDDDCVTNLYYELLHLMNQIRLPMAKWATNSKRLKEVWRTEGVGFKEVTQTLGIDWDTKADTFLMDPRDVIGEYVEGPTTKRQVLQTTARFYDPWACCPRYRLLGNYFRTHGAEDYLRTKSCRVISVHLGTLGYLLYLTWLTYGFLDG
jgi:hypothetical protein